jgi:cholesterol transport system auxiliary component
MSVVPADFLLSDMGRKLRRSAVAASLLALAGCGGGVGAAIAPAPTPTFDLMAPKAGTIIAARAARAQLVINEPSALRWLDSERIVVKPVSGEITYLGGAQWPDRLPRLLQARMVQSFENARLMKLVGRPGEGLNADYLLISEIRSFDVVPSASGHEAVIEMSVRLVSARTGRIVAGEVLSARSNVASVDGPAVASGFNLALDRVLRDLMSFAARTI